MGDHFSLCMKKDNNANRNTLRGLFDLPALAASVEEYSIRQ